MIYGYSKYIQNKSGNDTENENIYFNLNFAYDCLKSNDGINFELISKNKEIFENIFKEQLFELFNCLYDIKEKNSFDIDFTAINTIIKIISEDKNISNYEFNSISYFLIELSKMINNIFNAEIQLNNKISILRQNYVYILIIYGCSSIALIFFINRHFMRNKNKYENKMKKRDMKYSNLSNNNVKNNVSYKNENSSKDKKLSNEELEYIQKLAKENKADFLISK